MREQLERLKKRVEDDTVGPERPADFGFTYPYDYVQRAAWWLETYNILPEAGGWTDQDELLLDDIMTFLDVRNRLEWEVDHGSNSDNTPNETDRPTLKMSDL